MTEYRFYRYLPISPYTITNLINETLYFNHISEFDDPVDSAFTILFGENNLVKIDDETKKKTEELYLFLNKNKHQGVLEPINTCQILETLLKDRIGVCCFSRHELCSKCMHPKLNPLMLSSYAAGHTGIVLEFYCNNPSIFNEVVYLKEYAQFDYTNILHNLKFNFKSNELITNLESLKPLRSKFEEWIYQNEYRIFYRPNQYFPLVHFGLKVSRAYLGARTSDMISIAIQKIFRDKNIEYYFLKTPIKNNDKQRIIISSKDDAPSRVNCYPECKFK